MTIEKDLGRIATALEAIATAVGGATITMTDAAPKAEKAEKPKAEKAKKAAPKKEEPAPAADDFDDDDGDDDTAPPPVSRDDVKKALKAYSALEGKEEAIKILKDTGESDSLSELDEGKFQAVINACS